MKMKKFFCLLLVAATILASLIILPVSADNPTVEVLGASIRITGEQGLRFIGRVSKHSSLVTGTNANFGFLLIPSSSVSNTNITSGTSGVKVVKAQNLMPDTSVTAAGLTYDSNYYYFTAVLKGIPEEFYGSEIVARAYAPNVTSTVATRSVASVAQGIANSSTAPAAQKTLANSLLAVYNSGVGIDILMSASTFAQLVTYPTYSGIATDSLYTVSVTQYSTTKNLTVYNETADYVHFSKNDNTTRVLGSVDSNRRFCEFAFDWGAVTVNIRVNKKFNTYVVSPTSKGIASTYSNGVISVTLDKPEYFLIILDDDYNTALSVFADLPETNVPTKGSANVIYVEGNNSITDPSGIATYSGTNNEVMTVCKNDTVIYVAPGAVLKKRIVVTQNFDNGGNRVSGENGYKVKICGRGIIMDPYSDFANSNILNYPTTVNYDNKAKSVTSTVNFFGYSDRIEDVKLVNSSEFNVSFHQGNGYANHVKLLSTEMSTDGFFAGGARGTSETAGVIENCFVYVGDNALVLQNDTTYEGYTFRNIIVGTTCAALYPQHHANGVYENIYIFRADDGLINVQEDSVGSMTVTINNMDALDCVKTPTLFKNNGNEGTDTKTFNIKNLVMRNTTGGADNYTAGANSSSNTAISASNSNSSGYVLNFTNLYVGGSYVSGNNNTGGVLKVNSNAYAGTSTNYGVTCTFTKDTSNAPAHTAIPANKTANYTGGAAYVAGPVDTMWTRYKSYACDVRYSSGTYTVKKVSTSETDEWGLVCNLSEYARANDTGTYNVTYRASVKTRYYVIKAPVNGGSTTKVASNVSVSANSNKTISVSVTDVQNYNWYVVVTLEEDDFKTYSWSSADIPSSFTVSNTSLAKA